MIYKKTITVLLLVLLLTVNLMSQNEPDSIYVDTIQLKKLVTEHKKYKDLDSLNTELLIIKNRRLYQQELKIEKLYSISEIDSLMINNYKEQLTLKDKWYNNKYLWFVLGITQVVLTNMVLKNIK